MKPRTRVEELHPLLLGIPLSFVILIAASDALYVWTARPWIATVAYWCVSGVILGGAVAAAFGLWERLTGDPTVRRAFSWHDVAGFVVVLLLGFSWFLRRQDPGLLPSEMALDASFCAAAIAAIAVGDGITHAGHDVITERGETLEPRLAAR